MFDALSEGPQISGKRTILDIAPTPQAYYDWIISNIRFVGSEHNFAD